MGRLHLHNSAVLTDVVRHQGPIKFLLQVWCPSPVMAGYVYEKQVASNYFDGYDKLLDAFYEIGSCLPQFQDIADIYQDSDTITHYLALFYAEIIEFHYQAIRFFRRTGNMS